MVGDRSKLKRVSAPAVGVRGYRIRDLARAAERRREILLGAARAFAHGGYDATNMDQIARECGLAKGHIYHYFRSKEEIFTEIRADAVIRQIEKLAALAPAAAKDPELALRKAIASGDRQNLRRGGTLRAGTARPGVAQRGESKAHSNLGQAFRERSSRTSCAREWTREFSSAAIRN